MTEGNKSLSKSQLKKESKISRRSRFYLGKTWGKIHVHNLKSTNIRPCFGHVTPSNHLQHLKITHQPIKDEYLVM